MVNSIQSEDSGESKLERSSGVGVNSNIRIVMVVVMVVCAFVGAYYVFDSDKEKHIQEKISDVNLDKALSRAIPIAQDSDMMGNVDLPLDLPDIPKLIAPIVAPPLIAEEKPVIEEVPAVKSIPSMPIISPNSRKPIIEYNDNTGFNAAKEPFSVSPGLKNNSSSNRESPMLVVSGTGVAKNSTEFSSGVMFSDPSKILGSVEAFKNIVRDKAVISEDSKLARTSFEQVQATYMGVMGFIISQGRLIDVVLESAIDTDLSGVLRGIVSKNVFADDGSRVLVPRGSRLIGSYNSSISYGQKRVDIVWNRLILPNGIDIDVGSNATDSLGRTGVAGAVNSKFFDTLKNAVLLSSIKVGSAYLIDKLSNEDNPVTTVVDDNSNVVTTGSLLATVASDTSKDFSKTMRDYLSKVQQNSIGPTIKIPSGTQTKVFINKDLVFPKSSLKWG